MSRPARFVGGRWDARRCDDPAYDVPVLPRPDGRAAWRVCPACRGGPVRVQPLPAAGESRADPNASSTRTEVPWTGFDLINAFNAWKNTEHAGRVFAVDANGVRPAGPDRPALAAQVCQQVFEEAAVDFGRALTACPDSRSRKPPRRRVRFPRWKTKTGRRRRFGCATRPEGPPAGDPGRRYDRPRSVTLPEIGPLAVRDDTRRLRRPLATVRAKSLSPPLPAARAAGGCR